MADLFGVETEDLRPNELQGYMTLVDAVRNSTLTVEKLQSAIGAIKDQVDMELSQVKDTPQTWLSVLSFLIPIVGLIRKWYQDQKFMQLQARAKNLNLILGIFANSARTRKELERQIDNLKKSNEANKQRGGEFNGY